MFLHRLIAGVLCISLSVTLISCTSEVKTKTESERPSSSQTSEQSKQSKQSEQTEQPIQFVTRLTKNGKGLVRNVPPSPFASSITQPMASSNIFDIRWLNCPKYLNDGQMQKLKASAPNITFNSKTVWPEDMPSSFDHSTIMEAGKNPGLGVYDLHKKGLTGKGISIAIIDQILYTDHQEYKDNLALYEEIHVVPDESTSFHGSAVASIATGKTCGVAPNAKLYYWAVNPVKVPDKYDGSDSSIAFADGFAVAVDRMLAVNATLPENEKIRVLSISQGFNNLNDAGVETFIKSVKKAQDSGIFVITTSTYRYSDFMSYQTDFAGLGKISITGNPDSLSTYTLGRFEQDNPAAFSDKLLIPMDDRTTADPSGAADYAFYTDGGFSWVAPYVAGLYALAAQTKPDIKPEIFWRKALETSNKVTVTLNNKKYIFNHVINPAKLIDSLK